MAENFEIEKFFLPAGIISLALGIAFGKQFTDMPFADFLSGMFYGLSLTFNLAAILNSGKAETA